MRFNISKDGTFKVCSRCDEKDHMSPNCNTTVALPGDQPPRGAWGNAGVSNPEQIMDHKPASEDVGSRLEQRRPVETTAAMVGSGNCRPVYHLKQIIGQCPSGKRTSVRC